MKKILVFILIGWVLASCSTDVDLYVEYHDIAVVYGLLDAKADTNFIKITKAFCPTDEAPMSSLTLAQIPDSNNYPGKLDAFIEELKSTSGQPYQPTGRRILLDTLTKHNKKEGVFYAPHQKLYYTTEPFHENENGTKYHYKLHVTKPNGDVVTAETGILSGNIVVTSPKVSFQSAPTTSVSVLNFFSTEEGMLYEIAMHFNYWEEHPGQPLEKKGVSWSYGTKPLSQYELVGDNFNSRMMSYDKNTLFTVLERVIGNDTVWDENHPNVIRYLGDFVVYIAAAGEDFHNYYQFSQAMQDGLSLSTEYSNVEGGWGLFSSRILVGKTVGLSSMTKYDLFAKPWGFRERGTKN